MQLLKDSRTAARPATFPHRAGGNPLHQRNSMAFEEVLLAEGTNHVGKLLFNLYKNEHCNDLAKELLAVCVGASDAQLHRIHTQLSSLAQVEDLDEPLIESLCRSIQTLQQRARLGRMHVETQELKVSISQSREALAEAAAEHADNPQSTAQDVDGLLELLETEKGKLLPLHEQISTSFLFDGSQFDSLSSAVEEMGGSMGMQKDDLDSRFSERKEHVKSLRKKRRELHSSQDDEEDDEEQHGNYLARMKAEEDTRKAAVDNLEEEIRDAIAGMESVGADLRGVDAKVAAATQLKNFIATAEEVFSECTSEQREAAENARSELTKEYAEDTLKLCDKLQKHFTLQCKRVNLFKARLAPKEAELKKLERLCLGEEEASTNRQSLESEVQECKRLIAQSLERVAMCSAKLDEHAAEFMRLAHPDASVTVAPLLPECITGGHFGSFMANDQKDKVPIRVTVDPHGLAMYRHEALIAFYEYRAIKSWDMSSTHFGLTPSSIADRTRQSTRKIQLDTLEGREIAKMMSANAHLLVNQKKDDGDRVTERALLEQRQRIADFATLLTGYADGAITYNGALSEDGIPEGDGVLTLTDGCKYEGEFRNGQPDGRGKYTMVAAAAQAPGGVGRVYEGEFVGLRPVGGGHIYRVVSKENGSIADVYEGQLYNFSLHGAGRLRSASAVEGMICHYEGCFDKGEPSSRYARLWMMSKAKGGAYKRLSADRVAMYLGPIHAGVPSAANAQLVLPPLPGQTARTTYQGTFDNVKYLDYGKPSGSGSIMFANGNMYTGPIMEGPGGSFMPVPMAGELTVRSEAQGSAFDCIYKGEFDNQGRPDGEGKMVRESDGKVVHEGKHTQSMQSNHNLVLLQEC